MCRMIVDTHLHYSQPSTSARPHDPTAPSSSPSISVEDVLTETQRAGIDKIVQVTQTKMGFDNRYGLEGLARYPDRVLGVIGRFDPFSPGLEERLSTFVSQPGILGIRLTLLNDVTKRWLLENALDPFFSAAGTRGVAVQIYAPNQAPALLGTIKRFPQTRFIVDHMAMAHGHTIDEAFAQWPTVLALAAESNVWMKVSFFPEAAQGSEHFPYPLAQERFRELYERVGAERLLWGSNYPPVLKACSYTEALDFVREYCAFLTPADRAAILGGNFLRDFVATA